MSFSEIIKTELPDVKIPDVRFIDFALHKCHDDDATTKIAIIDAFTNESYTYAELYSNVNKVAFGLYQRGLKKGDVVSMITSNCPAVVFIQFGILAVGAVITSITTTNTAEEIEQQLRNSNTSALIISEVYVQKVVQAIKLNPESCVKLVFIIEGTKDVLESNNNSMSATKYESFENLLLVSGEVPQFEVDLHNDVIALIYSSGTTDRPKGIMHTNKSLLGYASAFDNMTNLGKAVPCTLPLHHMSGIGILVNTLRQGNIIITFYQFSLPLFFEVIEKYKVTSTFYSPVIPLSSWAQNSSKLKTLTNIVTGGAPMSSIAESFVADFFKKHCPSAKLSQIYACTEAGIVTSRFSNNHGSSGIIAINVQLKFEKIFNLFSPQLNKTSFFSRSGKIYAKTAAMMKGYLNNEEKTRAVLSEDGWYETGDVGFMDDNNELFVLNRTSELINYKGSIYFPQDWESAFIGHNAVKDVAVVGKQDTNDEQIPIAFVILNVGFEIEDNTKASILLAVNKILPTVMQLTDNSIIFIDSIPRTNIGKILRRILIEKFL